MKVGDHVEIAVPDRYAITEKGSLGIITTLFKDERVEVAFYKCTGTSRQLQKEYIVYKEDLKQVYPSFLDIK